MSVAGISSSNFLQSYLAQNAQNKFQQIQNQFQQLGQDLQAGNLTQAQADYATLSQELPAPQQSNSTNATGANGTNNIVQEFQQLGQDLQSGNLSAAQQDFSAIQQDAQQSQASQFSGADGHHHGHHHVPSANQSEGNTLSQAFGALGQALQSGNLSSAQQAYASLQQDLQQFLSSSTSSSAGALAAALPTTGGSVSIHA